MPETDQRDFDEEFMQSIVAWRERHRLREDEAVTQFQRNAMTVRPELSDAPGPCVQLATGIVNFVQTPDEVIQLATRLWPRLSVYRGHAHIRLKPEGDTGIGSIYVELD